MSDFVVVPSEKKVKEEAAIVVSTVVVGPH